MYSIIYFVKIHCRAMHAHTHREPTGVENTAYCIIQSVEYSVKYTRQTDVTQHVNQLDNSCEYPEAHNRKVKVHGLWPQGHGPVPILLHVRKHPMGGLYPEATIGRSWPLATTTWAGYRTLYTVWSKSDRPYFQQRPQSKGHSYGLWPQWHGKPWQCEPGKYVVASQGFVALWFFLSGDKEEVRGESESASRART